VAKKSVLALFAERRCQIAEGIEANESELDEHRNQVPLKRYFFTPENTSLPPSITLYIHRGKMPKEKKRKYHIRGLLRS
jgi:hypothetical protein